MKNLFRKLFSWLRSNTSSSSSMEEETSNYEFKLKVITRWYSGEWVGVKYTINGGKTWKDILECNWNFKTGYNSRIPEIDIFTTRSDRDLSYLKSKFYNEKVVEEHNKRVKREYDKGWERVNREKREIEELRKGKILSFNKQ